MKTNLLPWQTDVDEHSGGWFVLRDCDGDEIGSGDGGYEECDARRIVACVNACAGINTDQLERINLFEQNSKAWAAATKANEQRDELLAALKETKKALEASCFIQPSPITDTLWMTKSETLFDFIDAAIAKADLHNEVS